MFEKRLLIFFLVASCFGCASSPPSVNSADLHHVKGLIVRVTAIPTTSTSTDQGREWMGSMYGAVGLLMNDILSTKKGYPVYVVKGANGLEMNIVSYDEFKVGDCVEVRFPASMGERPDLGIGKAGITKATDCTTPEKS